MDGMNEESLKQKLTTDINRGIVIDMMTINQPITIQQIVDFTPINWDRIGAIF